MGTNLARLPGVHEGQCNRGSGVASRNWTTFCVSNQTSHVATNPVGGAGSIAVPNYTALGLVGSTRVNFPCTLVALISQATPVATAIRIKVIGLDQFGERQTEETPLVALDAVTNNYVYLSKVFSHVTAVYYKSDAGLDIAGDTLSLGTRWDWTRTDDATNRHKAGRNLGMGLPLWMRYRPKGAGLTHKRMDYPGIYPEPKKAFRDGTFTGAPTAADTITLDGVIYTWRAAVGVTANEVLIGASPTEHAANLAAAIMRDPGTAGVKYGSATAAHGTISATSNAGVITFTYRTAGSIGNSVAISESTGNFTFSAAATTLFNGMSSLCEVMCMVAREVNIATPSVTNISMASFEVGFGESGWTPSLEKVGIINTNGPLGTLAWAVTDNYLVQMQIKSLDGAW